MIKEKQLQIDEIKEQIERYCSFVIMRYKGLSANKANEFRKEVSRMGGDVEIMRKRLLLKAAEAVDLKLDTIDLQGHIGVVYAGDDPIETAKYIFKFSLENNKAISVVAGRIDGKMYGAADVEMLSQLPNKDGMRAQLLSLFEAPMAQTLSVMEAILTSVPYCLDNKSKAEEPQAEEAQAEEAIH